VASAIRGTNACRSTTRARGHLLAARTLFKNLSNSIVAVRQIRDQWSIARIGRQLAAKIVDGFAHRVGGNLPAFVYSNVCAVTIWMKLDDVIRVEHDAFVRRNTHEDGHRSRTSSASFDWPETPSCTAKWALAWGRA
jgi:hypothetical protein